MREMEIVTLAVAADGKKGPRRAKPGDGPKHAALHTECLNCGATLHGRYCADCGQGSDDHHRSILHLIWEVIADFTHLDGRLMQTIPPLFLKPGALARDHFEGRRQRHVPPLRLFLISLLIFMLALEVRTHHKANDTIDIPGVKITTNSTTTTTKSASTGPAPPPAATPSKPSTEYAAGHAVGSTIRDTLKPPAAAPIPSAVKEGDGFVIVGAGNPPHQASVAEAENTFDRMKESKFGKTPFGAWVAKHGRAALANRTYFRATIFEWGHRLSILLLPIFAGMLALVYFYKRQFYIYDHLIVAMHFLSFTFLVWAIAYLVPNPVGVLLFVVATIWTPVNLFMTLRGAYGSSIGGALVKTLFLWVGALTLFLALLLGVIFIAMGSM